MPGQLARFLPYDIPRLGLSTHRVRSARGSLYVNPSAFLFRLAFSAPDWRCLSGDIEIDADTRRWRGRGINHRWWRGIIASRCVESPSRRRRLPWPGLVPMRWRRRAMVVARMSPSLLPRGRPVRLGLRRHGKTQPECSAECDRATHYWAPRSRCAGRLANRASAVFCCSGDNTA